MNNNNFYNKLDKFYDIVMNWILLLIIVLIWLLLIKEAFS